MCKVSGQGQKAASPLTQDRERECDIGKHFSKIQNLLECVLQAGDCSKRPCEPAVSRPPQAAMDLELTWVQRHNTKGTPCLVWASGLCHYRPSAFKSMQGTQENLGTPQEVFALQRRAA